MNRRSFLSMPVIAGFLLLFRPQAKAQTQALPIIFNLPNTCVVCGFKAPLDQPNQLKQWSTRSEISHVRCCAGAKECQARLVNSVVNKHPAARCHLGCCKTWGHYEPKASK